MAGFAVALFVALIFTLFYRNKNLIRNKKGVLSVFLLLSAVLVVVINMDLISILDQEGKSVKSASDIVLYKLTAANDDSYSERFENIEKVETIAFKSLAKIITFGIGVGSFETINQGFNIHNSYLEILLQTGLLGTILFITTIFFVFRSMFKSKKITAIIPIFLGLFSIMVFMTFHDILRGRIFWLPLALLMVYSIPNKSASDERLQS
jgi:O-antigen ligase